MNEHIYKNVNVCMLMDIVVSMIRYLKVFDAYIHNRVVCAEHYTYVRSPVVYSVVLQRQ